MEMCYEIYTELIFYNIHSSTDGISSFQPFRLSNTVRLLSSVNTRLLALGFQHVEQTSCIYNLKATPDGHSLKNEKRRKTRACLMCSRHSS